MRKLTLKNINGKDYVLELNRDAIKWLESNGFSLEQFAEKPITYYDLLWTSLFLKNNRDIQVNPNLAIKIMETYEKNGKNPSNVVKFAVDEYKAFMNALSDIDSTENDEELEITEA